jgi:hypothetical protein
MNVGRAAFGGNDVATKRLLKRPRKSTEKPSKWPFAGRSRCKLTSDQQSGIYMHGP